MQGDEVGGGDSLVERDEFDAESSGSVCWSVRVVGDNVHAESLGSPRYLCSDFSEAHYG